MSLDVLAGILHTCHFIAFMNTNNFCIGDVPPNTFLYNFLAVKVMGRPADVLMDILNIHHFKGLIKWNNIYIGDVPLNSFFMPF